MKTRRRFGFLAVVLALSLAISLAAVPAAAAGSNNFSSYTYSRQYVVEQGIMKGDGNGNYMFEDYVKRGDCILLIVRTFEFPTYGGFKAFADVPADSYYHDAIATMRAIGVAKGDGTNFFPERNITLEEGILLVSRSLSLADAKYKHASATEAGLRALFGTRSLNDKATRDDIAAMLYYARTAKAPDQPYKSESTRVIRYATQSGKPAAFQAADFVAAAAGATPAYVKFTLPSETVGRLYYRYGTSASQAVTAATAYYITGTPSLSQVSFAPASSFLGTATVVYKAYSAAGKELYTGEIEITVTKGQASLGDDVIRYSTKSGAPVTFKAADFQAACALMTVDTLSFVRFTALPAARQGTLTYFDGSTNRAVTSTTLLYLTRTPLLSTVTFTPAADYSGTVELTYTAYNVYSDAMYTARVVIEVEATSVSAAGTITYKGQKDTPVALKGADFASAAAVLSGGGLSYVQFIPPTNLFGKLYYRYGTAAQKTVSASDVYYLSQAPLISDVSLVPAEGYTGSFKMAYRAYNAAGTQLYIGYVEFTIAEAAPAGTDSITYTIVREGAATFNAADFQNVCTYLTGKTLGFVRFTLPDPASGRLYYRYGLTGEALVKETDSYYVSGTPSLSSVTFVSYWSAPEIVAIPYRAYSANGELLYTGLVTIRIGTAAQAQEITYSLTTSDYVTFSASRFKSAALKEHNGKKLADPYAVQFEQPSAACGALYENYGTSSRTAVSPSKKYLLSGSPNVGLVSFVPNKNFSGRAEMTYYAYGSSGELLYTGRIVFYVTRSGGSNVSGDTIYYTVDAGSAVTFSAYDFAAVGLNLIGAEPAYVRFVLPATADGRLYYRYGLSGQTTVTAVTNYYLYDTPSLSDISFLAASTAPGTVKVTYRAFSAFDELLYVGTIEITVYPAVIYAPEAETMTFTMRNNQTLYLPAGDLILTVYEVSAMPLSYITFTPPASVYGRLTYELPPNTTKFPVLPTTRLYLQGSPSLGTLAFTPASAFTGVVQIPYTAYSAAGDAICTGTIQIYVTS